MHYSFASLIAILYNVRGLRPAKISPFLDWSEFGDRFLFSHSVLTRLRTRAQPGTRISQTPKPSPLRLPRSSAKTSGTLLAFGAVQMFFYCIPKVQMFDSFFSGAVCFGGRLPEERFSWVFYRIPNVQKLLDSENTLPRGLTGRTKTFEQLTVDRF